MPRNPFDLARERAMHYITVKLNVTLDDGEPCAFRMRPARWADFAALGWSIPEFGDRKWEDLSADERTAAYRLRVNLALMCVAEARSVENAGTDDAPALVSSWIPCKLIETTPTPEQRATCLTVQELESIDAGAAFWLGQAVLRNTDVDLTMARAVPTSQEASFQVAGG